MGIENSRRNVLHNFAVAGVLSALAGLPTAQLARAADAALVAAAEKEGQLVVYGDPFTVPLLIKAFGAKYPKIKVTSATGDAWQIYNRFVAENAAGKPLLDGLNGEPDFTANPAVSIDEAFVMPSLNELV